MNEKETPKAMHPDLLFLEMAESISEASSCLRRHVGAVIIKNDQIIARGVNASPTGVANCTECIRKEMNVPSGEKLDVCMAVHAEQAAIIQCAINEISPVGAAIYVSVFPCITCLKLIIQAGITKIVAREGYPNELSTELLRGLIADNQMEAIIFPAVK